MSSVSIGGPFCQAGRVASRPVVSTKGSAHGWHTRPRRHPQGRLRPHLGRGAGPTGRSTARTSRAGRSTTSRARPPNPEPHLRLAVQRLVRPGHPALRRRRQELGAGRQQVQLRRRPRHAPVVRRHAASVGVQARLASRAVAAPTPTPCTPASRTPRSSSPPTAGRLVERALRPAQARHRPALAARRRRHVPAHDPPDPSDPDRIYVAISAAGAFRTDDGGTTWQPINQGLRSGEHSRSRTPKSATASTASPCTRRDPDVLFMQKHWDVMRTDNAGDSWHEVSGNLPTDFGFPIDVHAHEPETIYVVPIKSDSEHYPARRQAARLPQPHRRQRVGGADRRACRRRTATSTCCATRWRSTRSTSCGVYFGTTGGQVYASTDCRRHLGSRSCATCRPCSRSRSRRCDD